MYYVYILKSKLNGELYIGYTNNLKYRLNEHNCGEVSSTRRYMPWLLIYYEAYLLEYFARRRERMLKYHSNSIKELKKRIGIIKPNALLTQLKKNYKSIAKSGAGFSLMEIVLVLAIFSTSTLLVVVVFSSTTAVQRTTITTQRLSADARYTMDTISREIRNSTINYEFYENIEFVSGSKGWQLTDPSGLPHLLALIDLDGNRSFVRRKSLDPANDPWGLRTTAERFEVGDQIELCLETTFCVKNDFSGLKNSCNSDADCDTAGGEFCQRSCNFSQAWSDITPAGVRLTGGSAHTDEPEGLQFVISPPADPYQLIQTETAAAFSADQQPKVTVFLNTRATGGSLDERKANSLQTTVSSRYYGR